MFCFENEQTYLVPIADVGTSNASLRIAPLPATGSGGKKVLWAKDYILPDFGYYGTSSSLKMALSSLPYAGDSPLGGALSAIRLPPKERVVHIRHEYQNPTAPARTFTIHDQSGAAIPLRVLRLDLAGRHPPGTRTHVSSAH